MNDVITNIGKSTIQHGKDNNRIYLMKYKNDDTNALIDELNNLAKSERYGKICAKIPMMESMAFIQDGYEIEAEIPKFFGGKNTCYFLGKYFSMSRKMDRFKDDETIILEISKSKSSNFELKPLDENFSLSMLEERHVQDMANIYDSVFESYPFPIHDPEYLKSTMAKNILYFGAFDGTKLVALSSAELDRENQNAEMTDFATLDEYKGKNLSLHLLKQMEEVLPFYKIKTLYSIARASSPSMNITFARAHYVFGGKLLNNTQIAGRIENMNVWYRFLE
jgi:putative beta-lysine N-acetyltransferase